MRSRRKLKALAALSLAMAISTTGCTRELVNHKEEPVATLERTAEPESVAYIEDLTYSDCANFIKLQDIKLPYEFHSTYDSEHWDHEFDITGTYDLDQDGTEDSITFHCNKESMETELAINDAKIQETFPNPQNAYIIDLDTRDSYLNLVFYDNGMSEDPNYTLYQYDGIQITKLDRIGAYSEDAIAFDGYNRAVRLDSFLNQLDPAIIKGYYEQERNTWNYHAFDLSEIMGKELTIAKDMTDAYFKETDERIEYFDTTWAEDERMTLSAGDTIIINAIGEYENYQVKLADGREGILYFWIGD